MTSPWLAWPPGTDPGQLTRALAAAHENFVSTGSTDAPVRPIVLESWRRSRESGVASEGGLPPIEFRDDELIAYRNQHPLATTMSVVRRLLVEDAADSDVMVAVSDSEGLLMWVEGSADLVGRAESMNFVPGARWSESAAGTNAPGTALALNHSVQIYAHEHYARIVHPWSCSAAPVHDPSTGAILGVLDVTGGDSVASPHALTLVLTAVHAIESELRLQSLRRILRGGSLAQRSTTGARLRVLDVDHATLAFGGSTIELSARHSELMFLLASRPQGFSSDELSLELAETDRASVTVRAEMSRLRSVLGALAPTSRPYRLPTEITTDVAQVHQLLESGNTAAALAVYTGPVLPRSQAPGIARARRNLHDSVRASVLANPDPALLLTWGSTPSGRDDIQVWTAAAERLPHHSSGQTLAQLRVEALNEEFGIRA